MSHLFSKASKTYCTLFPFVVSLLRFSDMTGTSISTKRGYIYESKYFGK